MVKLGDIFNLQMGKTPSRANKDYWDNGNNSWVSISDLSTYDKYVGNTKEKITDLAVQESGIKLVPPETVIMSFKLSVGKTAITSSEVYTNEAIMAFIPTGKYDICTDYFFYFLSYKDWSVGSNRAVMGATLNKTTLNEFKIIVPSISEQRRIASILDKVTDLIAKRRSQLEKLDLLVKSRFVEMFGDPVKNPKNWNILPLKLLGECKNGMNFHSDNFGVKIRCLGVSDFKDLSIINDVSQLPTISLNEIPNDNYLLKNGDIVFVRSNGNKNLVGRSIVVYPNNTLTTFSGFCIRFRILNSEVSSSYLLRVFKTESIRKKIVGRGANIQNLNQKILFELNIPVPPLSLQKQFANFVEQTETTKSTIQQSLETLETLKKALMQEYFA